MSAIASQITSLTIVYSTVYSGADQRKHQSSASLAFVWGIHRWPVNPPHKWPVTRKIFPFDDVIMIGSKPHNITQYFMECDYLSMSAILAYNTEFLLMITTWIKVVVHGRYFWLWKIIRSRWFDKSSLHFILWCLNRHWFRDWLGVIQTTRYWLIPNYDY